tara:strand:+ start:686 stop:1864 length:1179 start_codon:yes stop_codon:yes gene_type:complete
MIKGCILPWMHLYGDVQGQYKLCCHISSSSYNMGTYQEPISSIFNNENYNKIRNQMLSGNTPEMCKKACYDIEDLGGQSNRQQVNKRFGKFAKLQDYTNEDGSVKNNPIYLDIRFGNKCNFKCRICGPFASSSWFKDAKKTSVFKSWPSQLEDYYTDSPDFWNYLDKIKNSIEHFYFAGGEPLLMDGHYKLLQWFIDNDKTDVELTYNTNLSTLNYKKYDVFELWKNFKNVSLWPSVDGYKTHCQYSRTNFNWNTFETNLLKVKKYVKTVSCTTSIYSILSTPELIGHMKALNISTYLSVLDTPYYLDMRLLPKNVKNHINKKFDILFKKIPLTPLEKENIIMTVEYLNKSMNKDSKKLLKQFKLFNEEVDEINNTSYVKIFPELAEWYETI